MSQTSSHILRFLTSLNLSPKLSAPPLATSSVSGPSSACSSSSLKAFATAAMKRFQNLGFSTMFSSVVGAAPSLLLYRRIKASGFAPSSTKSTFLILRCFSFVAMCFAPFVRFIMQEKQPCGCSPELSFIKIISAG